MRKQGDGNLGRFRGGCLAIGLLAVASMSAIAPTWAGDGPPAPPSALPTIRWEPATLRLVERGGDYARMARLGDGRVGCAYDRGGRMLFRRSEDGGMTWGPAALVDEDRDCWLTNAELLATRGGALLYFWDERPRKAVRMQGKKAAPGELTRPFLIRMARSADHGRTWSRPRTLYTAGCSYEDGCWEPSPVELPSGEVLLFFANERPYATTDEQEISVLRSPDGGESWGEARAFAMRPGHRDGMPVPAVLADGSVAVAIEDDGLPGGGGRFKPAILHRRRGPGGAGGPAEVIGGESPDRWGALAQPLDPSWYAGAPYLRRLMRPGGFTVLSFQEGKSGDMRGCRLAVCVGDPSARGFVHKGYPIDGDPGTSQLWGSLFVKDEHTITAMAAATVRGVRGVWAVDGRVD
ncbi:hypothetical protein OJF2_78180 [Aquisphaera giovannonii]|uniref:Sialidase domain-containing protein n=1 Tax=Aquisphaera giovannonii TaxID=406548 RepID=A0A5B9WG85_9BACT|nr:sialidase family protein [Aquisphaera giovannonii]QEH39204.1 hypothetical protein OJF2_78180 [Aquisphaera giovannonii]